MFSGLSGWKAVAGASVVSAALLGVGGCTTDKPHDYGQQRPDIYDIDSRDRDLQSADINQAADQMAADLLSDPGLNESQSRWTLVNLGIKDQTNGRIAPTDFDLFLQALKARLVRQGRGRVQFITNRDAFYEFRDRELEGGGRDEFGQGGGGIPRAAEATNPEYGLTGVARNLPRRGTNYYQIEFTVVNLRNRLEVWSGLYAVKVAR